MIMLSQGFDYQNFNYQGFDGWKFTIQEANTCSIYYSEKCMIIEKAMI